MNMGELETNVLNYVKAVAERETVSLDMDLLGEDGITSIEVMELLGRLEMEFKIKLPTRDLRTVSTVQDLAELIGRKLGAC